MDVRIVLMYRHGEQTKAVEALKKECPMSADATTFWTCDNDINLLSNGAWIVCEELDEVALVARKLAKDIYSWTDGSRVQADCGNRPQLVKTFAPCECSSFSFSEVEVVAAKYLAKSEALMLLWPDTSGYDHEALRGFAGHWLIFVGQRERTQTDLWWAAVCFTNSWTQGSGGSFGKRNSLCCKYSRDDGPLDISKFGQEMRPSF